VVLRRTSRDARRGGSFESGIDFVKILQIELQRAEMFEREFVVAVDHEPLTALRFGIWRVERNGQIAAQMTANNVVI
jgi:hypothetical protein